MIVFLFGAGSITDAHSTNEHVKVQDLERAAELSVKIMEIL